MPLGLRRRKCVHHAFWRQPVRNRGRYRLNRHTCAPEARLATHPSVFLDLRLGGVDVSGALDGLDHEPGAVERQPCIVVSVKVQLMSRCRASHVSRDLECVTCAVNVRRIR
jgi:hypothetical protein